MRRTLELTAAGAAFLLLCVGFMLAAPFWIVASWLDSRADDLAGGWRRARKQNPLWRWARSRACI